MKGNSSDTWKGNSLISEQVVDYQDEAFLRAVRGLNTKTPTVGELAKLTQCYILQIGSFYLNVSLPATAQQNLNSYSSTVRSLLGISLHFRRFTFQSSTTLVDLTNYILIARTRSWRFSIYRSQHLSSGTG